MMLRGINRQQIFEDSEDYEKFLQVLMNCQRICMLRLLSYGESRSSSFTNRHRAAMANFQKTGHKICLLV